MTTYNSQPPWEFLLNASHNTLQSYELSRLNHAASLRKEITSLLDQWMTETSSANLARWLMQQRELSVHTVEAPAPPDPPGSNGHTASDNFLADRAAPPHASRARG